jgi:hypothetical protein
MTIVRDQTVTCAICGHSQTASVLISTNTFGSADLDTRPPGHAGWALLRCIMRCDSCGYCAPNIGQVPEALRPGQIPRDPDGPVGPSVAQRWDSWSRVNETVRDHATAARAALCAAWASDDAQDAAASEHYRLRAAEQFRLAKAKSQSFAENPIAEELIRADVLRRAGQFESALASLAHLPEPTPETLRSVASFERALLSRTDSSQYTIADAIDFASNPDDWFERHGRSREARTRRARRRLRYVGALGSGLLLLLHFDQPALAAVGFVVASISIILLFRSFFWSRRAA